MKQYDKTYVYILIPTTHSCQHTNLHSSNISLRLQKLWVGSQN